MPAAAVSLLTKLKSPRKLFALLGLATVALLLVGFSYSESPRFLARSILQNQLITSPTSIEAQTLSRTHLLDEVETRQLISEMASASHANTWDFYSYKKTPDKADQLFRFTLIFHFPLGLSTTIPCCKRASEHCFACWTTKDDVVKGLFVWRDPDEWHIPLSANYKFIEWAKLDFEVIE